LPHVSAVSHTASHLVGRTTATFPQQGQQNGLPDVKNSVFFTLMLKLICCTHKMALWMLNMLVWHIV